MPDKMLRTAGRSANGLAKAIKVTEDGTQEVQVTGRKVIKKILVDDLEIRATNSITTDSIDTSEFKSFVMYARTSLNQSVKLYPLKENHAAGRGIMKVWDGENFVAYARNAEDIHAHIPAEGSTIFHLNNIFTEMNDIGMVNLSIQLICDIAPTEGTLNVWIEGVPA